MFKFKAEKQTHLAHKTCLHNALRAFGGEGEANEAKQSIMPTKHYVPWNPDSGDVTGSDPTHSNILAASSAREESRQTGSRSTSGRKARGKYKTFNDRMDDLRRYKHPNVTIPDDKSLAQFCANARYARKNPDKGMQLTEERIAAFAP